MLGDFKEGKSGQFKILDNEDNIENLIYRCLQMIQLIHSKHNNYSKVLVTSDSAKFLKRADELPFVYTIPGEIKHIDYNADIDRAIGLKSFIDLFVLSKAKVVTIVHSSILYNTSFATTAARITDTPVEWYNLDEYDFPINM